MNGAVLMRAVAEGFEQADLTPLLDSVSDDIVWKSAVTTPGWFRFGGVYRGRSGVVQLTAQLATAYLFHRLRPRDIVAKGDTVWGAFEVAADYLPDRTSSFSRPIAFDCAFRWRLRRGKIVEHQGFLDTHALLLQQRP